MRSTADEAVEAVPGIPRDEDGPVFRAPWEAEVFALAVALHERGVFTWPEWAAALGEEIRRAGDPDAGDGPYGHWLAALERLVTDRHLTDRATLARHAGASPAASGQAGIA